MAAVDLGRDRRGILGQSGAYMLDVRHIVEQAHFERGAGIQWIRQGDAHERAELAGQAADKLRAQGFRVRVRPIVV